MHRLASGGQAVGSGLTSVLDGLLLGVAGRGVGNDVPALGGIGQKGTAHIVTGIRG